MINQAFSNILIILFIKEISALVCFSAAVLLVSIGLVSQNQ
jgi:hypothetical protein